MSTSAWQELDDGSWRGGLWIKVSSCHVCDMRFRGDFEFFGLDLSVDVFYTNFLILSMQDTLAGVRSLKNLCRGSSLGWWPEWRERVQEHCGKRIMRI